MPIHLIRFQGLDKVGKFFLSPVALSLFQAWLCVHPQAVVGEEENEQDCQYTRVTHPGVRTLKRISPLVLLVAPKKAV